MSNLQPYWRVAQISEVKTEMLLYKWGGDENYYDDRRWERSCSSSKAPQLVPCLAFCLPDGVWAPIGGRVMSGRGGPWDENQLPQWVFQSVHVMNVVKEDGE